MARLWVAWEPRGRDPYTNPRSRVAHAADARPGDAAAGSFPLACGRWAPDGMDAVIRTSAARRCSQCERAVDREEE